jgi:exonuclease SbcD
MSMKFIHTADWHLGKLVQGVYMTEDQRFVLNQLVAAVELEQPDAVVIAGDLYDRAIPPTEAIELLDELFERIVLDLKTPVIAIAGNHDSPDRVNFATKILEGRGLHLIGQLRPDFKPVVLRDAFGEVHFHAVPYADPAQIRHMLQDEEIRSHDDAMKAIVSHITSQMNGDARHVFVGHAFVTPSGEARENTSESERPLAIGGAEHVHAEYFERFHYTALGHLHQAHFVSHERIRYAGSPLKYSISEENHQKGFLIVELDAAGAATIEKRPLTAIRDMRRITATIEEIETEHIANDDYVFVTLLNENPVLFPMEKVRAVYSNAMHVERRIHLAGAALGSEAEAGPRGRREADPVALFAAFYREVSGKTLTAKQEREFAETLASVLQEEGDSL